MSHRAWTCRAAWGLCMLWGNVASGNGRYPSASQMIVAPLDPTHLVARTTFGILGSSDDGATWSWVCEDAVGYFGVEDPSIALTAGGVMVVASSAGVTMSTDEGCSWNRNPGLSDDPFGVDVTVIGSRPHEALAVVSTYQGGAYSARLLHTSDESGVFAELGAKLSSDFVVETVEVARSRPDRVYLSGRVLAVDNTSLGGAIQRSDDGGLTWTRWSVGADPRESIFIGAVDPNDPERIYVRTRSDATSRVLSSGDGAETWQEIWRSPGPVLGLALSPDGATIAVGSPGAGVHIASTVALAFERVSDVNVECLAFRGERLLACGNEARDGFLLGSSDDGGRSFQPLLHQSDLVPRVCPASTTAGRVCTDAWPPVAALIGAAGLDGGRDASSDVGPSPVASGGCGCVVARPARTAARSVAFAVVFAALVIGRRRRSTRLVRATSA